MRLLLGQLPGGELAGFGAALHLLLQMGRFFLQGEEGVLALFVLADAVLQLLQAQGQPVLAPGRVLGLPLLMQRMCFEAWGQGLLFFNNLLVLQTQFLHLGFQGGEFIAQQVQFFFEVNDHFAGVRFFEFVVARQALQQGFGLVVGVLMAATYRAGLIVLQLFAQFLYACAACQALALQQLACDFQSLLSGGEPGLGVVALFN